MNGIKVLIVEDSMTTAKAIKKSLLNLEYEVVGTAASGEEAIKQALLYKPNIILMDIILEGEMNGIETATKITNILNTPIIYLTGISDKNMLEEAKISEGYSFLVKPFQENELYFNIEMTLYKHKMKNKLEEERKWLSTILESIGDGVISIDNEENIKFINESALEILGLNKNVVGSKIFDILQLFDINTGEQIDIMNYDEKTEMILKNINNKEYIIKYQINTIPKKFREKIGYVITLCNITEEKKLKKDINYLTFNDQLTGVYNRTYFEKELSKYNDPKLMPVSILMADVNGLKLTNDVFGHLAGDELLKKAADIFKKSCRSNDLVARIGGDEFVIIFPNTSNEIAKRICERIKLSCNSQKTLLGKVSVAIGISTKENNNQDIFHCFDEADHRMYSNKFIESKRVCEEIFNHLKERLKNNLNYSEEGTEETKRILMEMGRKVNLTEKQLYEISLYSEIGDIGMVVIPNEILNKKAQLNDKEWDIIKRHPETGYKIAIGTKEFTSVSDFILSHHERWDGKGYPHRLKGEEIPLVSRMISIVEAYNSMISEKSYKKKLNKEEAVLEISKCAGTQFDPKLVEIFKLVV